MNINHITMKDFSNHHTKELYLQKCFDNKSQCGECSFYAMFEDQYGLCCHDISRFYLETVFKYFGCDKQVPESWESHSFSDRVSRLPDRSHLISLISRWEKAIAGIEKGSISRDTRLLYLEVKQLLREYERAKAESRSVTNRRHR